MKTPITIAVAVVTTLALAGPAWAGGREGRHHHGEGCRHEACPPPEPGPDANGDGKVTTYERIQWARKQRFERHLGG